MKMKLDLMLILLVVLFGCSENGQNTPPLPGNLQITFQHEVDGDSLQFSKMIYQNAAGNTFRVVRLYYFISGFRLFQSGEEVYRQSSDPVSINALYPEDRIFRLSDVPLRRYDSLAFSLGVVPEYNYEDAFQLSNDDLHMYWPTSLGGGYHFMKFEGHWQDGADYGGYAFHIGQNENLVTTGFAVNLEVYTGQAAELEVVMNVNQWFEQPYLYDLKKEGGYTMGDTLQMRMLVSNGHNVFSLRQQR